MTNNDTKKKDKSKKEGMIFILLALLMFSIPSIISYHPDSLEGKFLIAASDKYVKDNPFYKTVIFIAKHDKNHAIGYVINKPLKIRTAKELYDIFNIEPIGRSTELLISKAYAKKFINKELEKTRIKTYWGGPLDTPEDRPKIIFNAEKKYTRKKTSRIKNTDVKISEDMWALNNILATGNDETTYKILLGYAGWGKGQLDKELEKGYWKILPYKREILFTENPEYLWDKLYGELNSKNAKKTE